MLNKKYGSKIERSIGLQFLGNLIDFDGVTLSVFGNDTAGYKMALWIDYQEKINVNRWIVFSAKKNDIRRYIKQKCTLLDLINIAAAQKMPYLYMMRLSEITGRFTLDENITEDYMPSADSFLVDDIRTDNAEHLFD